MARERIRIDPKDIGIDCVIVACAVSFLLDCQLSFNVQDDGAVAEDAGDLVSRAVLLATCEESGRR